MRVRRALTYLWTVRVLFGNGGGMGGLVTARGTQYGAATVQRIWHDFLVERLETYAQGL